MASTGLSPMEIDGEIAPHNMKDNAMTLSEESKQLSEEEEVRQAIEKLRGEDVSARVEAAYKLEAVAKTLGEERTRDVSEDFHVFSRVVIRRQNLSVDKREIICRRKKK